DGFSVEVTAKNGPVKVYTLQTGGAPLPVDSIYNATVTAGSISNKLLLMGGKTTYHITGTVNPLAGSFLQLTSTDVWLYFDNIKPSVFYNKYLDHISVNGQPAVIDSTVRLVQYLQGCVLISQPATYQPLQVFSAENGAGASMSMNLYTYYQAAQLGSFNDAIASFTLKKGYMASFSENENGTGASKVYIADNQDIQVMQLPAALKGKISFVRVFPWRWVAKKGWTNTVQMADTLGAKWTYNWNNDRSSTLDAEYVPIRQTQWWPSFSVTNAKTNVTHLLGFNEPDNASQSNLTPSQAIAAWPALMESGLRLGSPAITDGGASWLYSFMDKADSAGYRVDFVAVHFYRGCQSAAQFYSFLKAIHDRTGRPVWITEFNNGANWTNTSSCPQPTYAQEATAIQSFLNMLDTTSFVERYALYEWVQDTRQMFNSTSPVVLNPAGIIYRDKIPPMAYNAAQQFDPYPPVTQSPFTRGNLAVSRFGTPGVSQSGANAIFVDEYTVNGSLSQTISLPIVKYGKNLPIVSSGT
ncbi:MAG TPA: glycosyl hydrolase, partial [Chitinophagaceae bacterium]|nr:glycosyl hydrolase [Chitinophagaceae bacterium]